MGLVGADDLVVMLAPVAVYWAYAGAYELLGWTGLVESYRLHSRRDEETKNLASKKDVVKGVLLQQLIQAAFSLAVLKLTSEAGETGQAGAGSSASPSWPVQAAQFAVAMLVMDTWQYFMHRYMHSNGYLYRHVHSWHHRVVAPYAFAAQYNHPADGLLTETLSGAAAFFASGMSPRAATAFFVLATVKGVDDHCGLALPWSPLRAVFRNNALYHDVHHQLGGGRRNFSQPFFTVWDRLLGTHAEFTVQEREGGGFEVRRDRKDQMQGKILAEHPRLGENQRARI